MTNTAIARAWQNRTMRGMEAPPACTLRTQGNSQLLIIHDDDLAAELNAEFLVRYEEAHGSFVLDVTGLHVLLLERLRSDGSLVEDSLPSVTVGRICPGVGGAPWRVRMTVRTKEASRVVKSIVGVSWDATTAAWLCSVGTRKALQDLVSQAVLEDPEGLLKVSEGHVVWYDSRPTQGAMRVLDEPRADLVLANVFPEQDVVQAWKDKGIDVQFGDDVTKEIYEGELARAGRLQPQGMAMELYDYQKQSVSMGVVRTGLLIADEPGLGKTPTGIGIGYELRTNRGVGSRNIVICPSAVCSQWEAEIHRFCGPGQKVVRISGTKAQRHAQYLEAQDADWLIVHYLLLTPDFEFIQPLAKDAILIADEVHRVKNQATKQSQAAMKLSLLASRRFGLTGTPISAHVDELHSVMRFIMPGFLEKFEAFAARYMYKAPWGYKGARRVPELSKRTAPHIIRHLKKEVTPDLPPLRVQRLALDPDERLAKALARAHKEAKGEIKEAKWWVAEEHDASAMAAIGMLRMMCISPRLVRTSGAVAAEALVSGGYVPDVDGPKLDWIRNMAGELKESGERVVVFSTSKRMIRLVGQRLKKDGVVFVEYTGSTKSADRDLAVRRFTDPNDTVTVFLATDAAAEGLNLGRCCSTLVNIDLPWKAGVLTQRANRIHRVDTKHPSYQVINLTISSTMEDGMVKLLQKRAELADALLGEVGSAAKTTGFRISEKEAAEVLELLAG